MIAYAESSAILAWLLAEEAGEKVRHALGRAEAVFSSVLTLVECDRALVRAETLGELTEADTTVRRARLAEAAGHWHLLGLTEPVADRARRPFPHEPVRTLDALHLASGLVVRSRIPGIAFVTLDDRVRRNASALGFDLFPAD